MTAGQRETAVTWALGCNGGSSAVSNCDINHSRVTTSRNNPEGLLVWDGSLVDQGVLIDTGREDD